VNTAGKQHCPLRRQYIFASFCDTEEHLTPDPRGVPIFQFSISSYCVSFPTHISHEWSLHTVRTSGFLSGLYCTTDSNDELYLDNLKNVMFWIILKADNRWNSVWIYNLKNTPYNFCRHYIFLFFFFHSHMFRHRHSISWPTCVICKNKLRVDFDVSWEASHVSNMFDIAHWGIFALYDSFGGESVSVLF
jgi:hypothetical protein